MASIGRTPRTAATPQNNAKKREIQKHREEYRISTKKRAKLPHNSPGDSSAETATRRHKTTSVEPHNMQFCNRRNVLLQTNLRQETTIMHK